MHTSRLLEITVYINCHCFFAVAHYAVNVTFMVTTRWVGKIANGHWPTHF